MCVDHGLLKLLSFCKPDYPMPSVVCEATQYNGIGMIFFPPFPYTSFKAIKLLLVQGNYIGFKELYD